MQTVNEYIREYLGSRILTDRDVGIFCSGGFDSTTIAYCVYHYMREYRSGRKLTVFTVPRYDDSVIHAQRILDWLSSVFPEVTVRHAIVGDPDLHHSQQVLSGIIQALNEQRNLMLILGDTGVPPELAENAPVRIISDHERILQPFVQRYKNTTVELAHELGILDQVAEISHSCTQSVLLRCHQCWQCQERAWAFEQLGLVDIGKM